MDDKNEWINLFLKKFQTLKCEDKNMALDYIIEKLDAAQLYHLSTHLEKLIKRDFIIQLPEDISHYLLRFLDIESLLGCCKVSKSWNQVISGDNYIWKNACDNVGINTKDLNSCDGRYKKLFLRNKRMLSHLQKGSIFTSTDLYGHMDRVMAVYYNSGYLATGSDDHTVRIWDCQTGECVHVLRTHSVADIKFQKKKVFTASFDTTAACWDIDSGQTLAHYIGHVGAVFSIDFNEQLDVVVTGSADSTVKVWSLTGGQLQRTLTQHRSSWITHVHLFCTTQCGEENNIDDTNHPQYNTAQMSKSDTTEPTSNDLKPDNSNFKALPNKQMSKSDTAEPTSNDLKPDNSNFKALPNKHDGGYFIISQDNMSLHCWNIQIKNSQHTVLSTEEWQNDSDMALLPGLWKFSQQEENTQCINIKKNGFSIAFIVDNKVHIYECCFTKNVFLLRGMQRKRICTLPTGVYPQTYLGSGGQFDVFLVEYEPASFNRGPALYIVHATNPAIHASVPIPLDYRPSKRGSSFTLCNTAWLDSVLCLSSNKKQHAIFAVTMKDNRVHIISSNNLIQPDEEEK